MRRIVWLLPILFMQVALAQVKIGNDISTLDPASILELESSTKVFVLTRMDTDQMNAVQPLTGAMVYNTDLDCIYQYNGILWQSLCDDSSFNESKTVIFDNNDGTFSYTNENKITVTVTKAQLIANGDGSFRFDNGNGVPVDFVGTDNQQLSTDGTPGNILIENGNPIYLNTDDGDADDTNERNLSFALNGTALEITDSAGTLTQDLDGTFATDTELANSNSNNDAAIQAVQDDVDANETAANTAIATVQADVDQNEADADAAIQAVQDDVDANETAANTAIATVQADVDQNEADADAAIQAVQDDVDANETAANTAIATVQSDVDQNEADADAAIQAVQDDVDANETAAGNAIATVQSDVDQNEADADAAIQAVQDDVDANETAAGNAIATVQADVDQNEADADAAIQAVQDDVDANETAAGNAIATVQSDVDQNEADADAAIQAVQDDVDANETAAGNAIATVQADVDQNEADADAAIQAVQDDVDANETAANTAIAAVQSDVDQNEADADAAIQAVQDDVDANETAANTAIAAVQSDVDQNEADADAAIQAVQDDVDANETAANTAIATVQSDVDQNEADADAAIALKENAANKSTDTALGTSDVAFPTQNAVKSYVDAQVGTITTDDDITGVTFDGTDVTVSEGGTSFSADLSSLEESAAIATVQSDVDQNEADADAAIQAVQDDVDANETAANTAIATVQADVDANETAANTAIATVQSDVDQNEADADAAIQAVQDDVDANETAANTAIATVQSDVDQNEADADAAIALKENTANKSTDTALGTSDVAFPTQNAVKSYVDAQVGTITTDDDITGVTFDGTDVTVSEGGTSFSADLSSLEESAAIATVQSDVDQNEADADAAIALKENAANKSTDTALGTSDVAFPTQNAVKTYVDAQVGAITTDDDITGVTFDGTDVTVSEGGTSFSADLSSLEESAAIATVQADVDQNEADADAAIQAVQDDVDANETAANNAIATVQADVDQNEADADAAIALKENTANKSTDTALGTSDVAFPTQNAVKTYVDAQVGAITTDDDITGVTFDGTDVTVSEGGTSFSADLSSLEESAAIATVQADVDANEIAANTAIATVQADVDQNEADADAAIQAVQDDVDANETAANTAIATVQSDVDQNEADADAAIALKENAANKSTDTALGTSDVAFPTQNAVKSYVDAQVGTITTDDDITGVTFDGTDVTVSEGGTSFSADLSSLEESAAIATVQADVDQNEADADAAIQAVQDDVDANETAANTAITAVQSDVDQNESDADAAIQAVQDDVDANETAANTAIAVVQSDVDQNEADADAAIALKEDAANKSTDVNLADATDTKFPTEKAVKTYVDAQVGAITTDDDITGVTFDGTDVTVSEGGTSFSADLSSLEESAAIATVQADVDQNEADADAAIQAVQDDVDANETAANTAITAVQSDVDQNEADADAAIQAVQADVDANETAANTAIAAVQSDVDQNEADADAAIALKENTANKSTDTALGTSDVAFPTQNAVKSYVDAQVGTITTDDDITGVTFDGTDVTVSEGGTSFSADLSSLEESAAIATVQADVDQNEADADAAIQAVQDDVDANETATNTAIATVQSNVDQNEADADAAIALKEDTANKSTDTALGTSDVAFPTQNAVKTYVDAQVGTITTDDDITGVTFDGTDVTVSEGGTSFSADLSSLEESAAIATVQADVDANETAANTAIATVQSDVDQNEADADAAIQAVQDDVDTNETAANTAIATVQSDVDQNEADADAAIQAVQDDVDANETAANTAIATVQSDVNQNEADADAAIALKEDTANKSTDTALGTSDVAFPTQNAVKTYVDAQVGAITTDDDITGVTFDGTDVTVSEGSTSFSADLSSLEESAAIAAVQADVDQNEADADAAIQAVQDDVDANETAANTAIATVQSDVDQNEADADAAIALKEDTANKSTDTALGTSDIAFPTQNAVKIYVDAQVGAITTDDDITGVTFDGTDVTVSEGGTSFSADLSSLEESAAIATVQSDVDQNEADADAAIQAVQDDVDANETAANSAIATIQSDVDQNEADADAAIALKENTANKSTNTALGTSDVAFPTQNAVKTYVDAQVGTITTDDDITGVTFDGTDVTVSEGGTSFSADLSSLEESAAIATVQADVDANETAANTAIAAVQSDVEQNEADADAAIALKENTANKSTDTALGTSDVAFPTQNAVKTYVDAQVGTITTDDDITGVTFDGTDVTVSEGGTSFSADLSSLEESAAIATVQADVDQNEADADAAIQAVQDDVDANETAANTAITAVQSDVDQNEADADAAIQAVQDDVDANETAANTAIATVQSDVDQNEADADAAIALKEDAANKSTDVNLADATDTKFPTEKAVKTYVDAQVGAITTDDDITGVTFDGTDVTVSEGSTSFSADLSSLEESAAIATVQADVDANETAANTAIAAVQSDVDQNEADADAAIALKENAANKSTDTALGTSDVAFPTQNAVKTYVDAQVGAITTDDDITGVTFDGTDVTVSEGGTSFSADLSSLEESAAIATVQADVDANETAANTAIAAVQSDVDQNEADADAAIQAVQDDVDANETAANTAIAAVQSDVDQNEADADAAIALKEDTANKSTDTALGTSDVAFPTQNAVKTYVDTQIAASPDDDTTYTAGTGLDLTGTEFSVDNSEIAPDWSNITNIPSNLDTDNTNEFQTLSISGSDLTISDGNTVNLSIVGGNLTNLTQNDATGVISYVNEASTTQTAEVISSDTDNSISAGTDGGAFYNSMVKAIGKISAVGVALKATAGVTVTKQLGFGHYRVNLPVGMVSDANYIIQLSQPGRDGVGNDDPGISYSNQSTDGFDVIIGDNDNGGTARARFDSEFMFVLLDL